MNLPVNEQKKLKWKLKDGTLKNFNELSNEELKLFRNIAKTKVDIYYRNFEFFSEMLNQMDEEVADRLTLAEETVKELQIINAE
ncbi:MAG: hypothetical protein EBR82_39455 [Caulobacteraceae bacterium]|nr:hypothetical protein [Caulobacteraceae bacterium]